MKTRGPESGSPEFTQLSGRCGSLPAILASKAEPEGTLNQVVSRTSHNWWALSCLKDIASMKKVEGQLKWFCHQPWAFTGTGTHPHMSPQTCKNIHPCTCTTHTCAYTCLSLSGKRKRRKGWKTLWPCSDRFRLFSSLAWPTELSLDWRVSKKPSVWGYAIAEGKLMWFPNLSIFHEERGKRGSDFPDCCLSFHSLYCTL